MPPRKKTDPKLKAEDQIVYDPDQALSIPVNPDLTFTPEEDAEDLEAIRNAPGDTVSLEEVEAELNLTPPEVNDIPQEPEALHLEPLDLEDLIDDNNRVRMALNAFPVDIGEQTKSRLYVIAVPGEEGTFAAVWFENSPTGPQQAVPVRRISNWEDHSFVTEDGQSFVYTTSKGCKTCGNQLYTYRPWGGHVRVTQMSRR